MHDQEILSLEQDALRRWFDGDPLGWAAISAADLIYIDPNLVRPVRGLDEFTAYLQGAAEKRLPRDPEMRDPRVMVLGDAALLTYHLSGLWNVSEVYFRRGGEWKLVHSHWGYIHHNMPPRVEVPVPLQLPPAPYEGLTAELMALETAAMERWRKGDPYGFIELSAPDVSYIDTGTSPRIDGIEPLRAEYATRAGKIFFDIMDFVDPQVQVCGDLATLVYRFFSGALRPDGTITRNTAWYCSEVFVRRAGVWRILHTQWSFIQGVRQE
ncbi:DUF4440 domain-containing protein [bacterium]|nr:MAG: DUF4440 domain-containing protein [bacterium]